MGQLVEQLRQNGVENTAILERPDSSQLADITRRFFRDGPAFTFGLSWEKTGFLIDKFKHVHIDAKNIPLSKVDGSRLLLPDQEQAKSLFVQHNLWDESLVGKKGRQLAAVLAIGSNVQKYMLYLGHLYSLVKAYESESEEKQRIHLELFKTRVENMRTKLLSEKQPLQHPFSERLKFVADYPEEVLLEEVRQIRERRIEQGRKTIILI